MVPLTQARQRAQACRQVLGTAPTGLLDRVIAYLLEAHGIEVHAVNAAFLDGGRAEVSPAEGCLFYDARLDREPADKLFVMLHELGHLELHHRLQGDCAMPDPVLGSMYLNDGAAALARYHRRSSEEAEANAFATAFLCPSHEVLEQWLGHAQMGSAALAKRLGVSRAVVHAQLAEGLYQMVAAPQGPPPQGARSAVPAGDASQQAAATCTGRPVLVNAGPGTGKTATLVQRMAYLLNDCGAEPEQLLVLTFSNDAADELRQRIASHLGEARATRLEVSTFHGFGVKFLHHHGQFLNLDVNAFVLDDTGQEALVTQLLGTVACANIVALHHPEETVKQVVRHIGYLKDRLYTPDDFADALDAWRASGDDLHRYDAALTFADLYRAYEVAKQAQQRVDFADLIALPQRILAAHHGLRSAYRAKYKWVMVDEYQDVSRAVAGLLAQLCGSENPPWVVGDTRQAIYRFRGAAPENVSLFERDFPGANMFHLNTNYRASEALLTLANQLASLMATTSDEGPAWGYGSAITSPLAPAIAAAHAETDLAQYEGIARQIGAWLKQGVHAADIAVLARRNLDVRDISLALGRHGIRATTSGTVTSEGSAGDLAAIVTLADQPRASLPRLAFALGRGRFAADTINGVIRCVLETLDATGAFATDSHGTGDALAAEMDAVCEGLRADQFSGDAFAMMCGFLFDHSDVLRRILAQPPSAERSLALSEMVTCLSRAAAYRFLHPDVEPRTSRLRFAQYFRATLASSPSSVTPPKPASDVVRVMTCHAAKGLEFPYVIVAGQTLPPPMKSQAYAWLPPDLHPSRQEAFEQANALFFVGVTRAQRAVVVTYASSANGRTRTGKRELTPLLKHWIETQDIEPLNWASQAVAGQPLTIDALWGGAPRGRLSVRALDASTCAIRTYLEHFVSIRFPVSARPLYPIFFAAVRRSMRRLVHRAHELVDTVSLDEAQALFLDSWPSTEEVADHPHHDLYMEIGLEYVKRFARAYEPHPQAQQHLELVRQPPGSDLSLQHDLLAHYQAHDGAQVAIALRPESLQPHTRTDGVLWSGLSAAQRVSFVMLKRLVDDLQPWVFSAKDGALAPYQWPKNLARVTTEAGRVEQRLNLLEQRQFETTVQTWACDRCPVRVSCPLWMGAAG